MAFVKLDTGILESTLWVERSAREIFITSLLMAEPREISEPMEQLEVDTLTPTGFIVPPGWYGFVKAAGIGIIRRALVDEVEGIEALRLLGDVDLQSRSSDWGGRRLVRVDGGFIVLNFFKYRDKDHTAADRQARLRARRKAGVTPLQRDVTPLPSVTGRNVTQSDADSRLQIADAEAYSNKTFCAEPSALTLTVDASQPVVCSFTLNDGSDYAIFKNNAEKWKKLYPAVDVEQQLRNMIGWCDANPTKRKTRRGIAKFINSWLAKAQDRPQNGAGNGKPSLIDTIKNPVNPFA